jgi:hypothetical protein
MTKKVTVTIVRPNTDVNWYSATSDHLTYITSNYINTGKLTKGSETLSGDELTKSWESTFTDAGLAEWKLDSTIVAHFTASNSYNTTNSINRSKVEETL